jgi:hypothetical protein
MAVKAVETVRRIRDRNYEETRKLTKDKPIQFIRRKTELLRKEVARLFPRRCAEKVAPPSNITRL